MPQFVNMFPVDLRTGPAVVSLNHMFRLDADANRIGAIVTDGGNPVALGGSCAGTVILANGATVAVNGTVDGNMAYIVLPEEAYQVKGPMIATVTWVNDGHKTGLLHGMGDVMETDTGEIMPGPVTESVADLIDAINEAVESIPADYSALLATIAPYFNSSTAYAAGTYVWHSGTLYRFTAAHAAGPWTGTDAVAAVVGSELSDLTSAIEDETGTIVYFPSAYGKYLSLNGDTVDINAPSEYASYSYYLVPCTAGDVFTVSGASGTPRVWGFVDSASPANVLSKADSSTTVKDLLITAPQNAAYLVVNDRTGNGYVVKGVTPKVQLSDIYNALEFRSHNMIFYIASGGNVSWSDYGVYTPWLDVGELDYALRMDNEVYAIHPSDLLTSATQVGLSVTGNKISGESFAVYFDLSTKTAKVLKGFTIAANRNILARNPVIFCAAYSTLRCGLLVDYMAGKRIEKCEKDISNLSDGGVPNYYKTHIEDKRNKVLDTMMDVGKDGETFIFITDVHWENNDQNSPALVNYLFDNLNINHIVNGGDLINQGEKSVMIETMREAITAYQHRNVFMPCAYGNHDSNENFSPAQPAKAFSVNQQYALMQKQSEGLVTYFTDRTYTEGVATAGNWNFYFDVENTKTRIIVIDTGNTGLFTEWEALRDCMLSTPSGYHITLIGHWIDKSSNQTPENLAALCDGYNSRSASVSVSSYTFNLSTATATVNLILGGHQHKNKNWFTQTGIPFVLIDSDNRQRSLTTDPPRVAGTVTEQSFGVFTLNYLTGDVFEVKIGAGYNAIYNAGIVTVSTTETLTPSIVATSWNSSDESVATVENGVVTAVGSGSCVITASDGITNEHWGITVA